ncbi:PREDICTED: tudor and KH domain-containing protein [Nipponia nippon]|uniref:tudor and KH domain-containing protein n=1 Tax=Nipponia nippon TaxID=128390 RepID=UPI0005112480|nr:PREDICTED: tudor and KH domain-containing protein [Nipponia nippon]
MTAERGYWSSLTPPQKAAVVLGIPAGAAVLYILYRRYRESREERLTFVGDEELEMEVRVPRAAVKSIIGRKGATIKKLSQETGARIDVEREDEGEETVLLISGSPGQVCRAKAAVHQIVTESAPVSEQLCVPQTAVGRIIGRGGETVRGICRSSGAKVLCEREADAGLAPVRVIQLSGTRKEVAAAKKLIMEKLMEDDAFRKELAQSTAMRCQRKQPLGSRQEPEPLPNGAPEHGEEDGGSSWGEGSLLGRAPFEEAEELEDESEELEEPAAGPDAAVPKFEVPSPDFSFHADEHLEVYVSAAENPSHFWIQIIGHRSQHPGQERFWGRDSIKRNSPPSLSAPCRDGAPLRVFVPPHALKLPEEPITRWGEYWCDVTVNGLETVRVPMAVVKFLRPKTKRYKHWLAQQQAQLAAQREALL